MKEDVLEQVVYDYLKFKGYFTTHNVAFRPRSDHPEYVGTQDSVRSDVDVVGYHPTRSGLDRVAVVSCKAWQGGFDATAKLAELRGEKRNPKRETWRHGQITATKKTGSDHSGSSWSSEAGLSSVSVEVSVLRGPKREATCYPSRADGAGLREALPRGSMDRALMLDGCELASTWRSSMSRVGCVRHDRTPYAGAR